MTHVEQEASRAQRSARPPRHPVDIGARLRIGSHLFIVRVLDISHAGAKLLLTERHHREALANGAMVLMNAGCLSLPRLAEVVWLRGDKVGLSFQEPLSASDLESLARLTG